MSKKSLTIALVGNPNTGKSTIFNGLTGLKQKISNYPGVTVERKIGRMRMGGIEHRVIDLPGTYSLNHKKLDEKIAYQTLIGEYEHEEAPDLAVVILDASNLDRNLYLATQVMDLGIPMIAVLNMMDIAEERGMQLDPSRIEQKMGVPVVPIVGKRKKDVEKVREAIASHDLSAPEPLRWQSREEMDHAIELVTDKWLRPYTDLPPRSHPIEALRLLSDNQVSDDFKNHPDRARADKIVEEARGMIEKNGGNATAAEVLARYDFIGECTDGASESEEAGEDTLTDRIDSVVTHKVFGPVIFVAILMVMFQAIFSWAEPFMNMIDLVFIQAGNWVSSALPPGMLNDLLVEGVIAGLGGVVIFLPQIMFLFLFISLLEGTGYMARAAFVMDGVMTKIGLHGRSVVPLISGFACAVPGIMATRTIDNWRDRFITIMILPWMACSARLPVYALMIAAFIPDQAVFGFFGMQGLTFFGLYFFGIVMAILAAVVIKQFFPGGDQTPFMMELPSYKMPKWSDVLKNMFERGWVFVSQAGRIIIAISIILWFLASFPHVDVPEEVAQSTTSTEASFDAATSPESYRLKHSYAGRLGHFMEPAIEPLGFDWKIGIGLITSFAAREVVVGTLNTIYSVEGEGEVVTLQQKLINDVDPDTGQPVYTTLTAISLMIFFALAMQCMSTLAIVRRETNSWKWPIVMFVYMTSFAYLCSLLTFQLGTALGYG